LISEGVSVTAVARGREGLDALRAQAAEPMQIVQADAADSKAVQRLLHEFQPNLTVLAAGVRPLMAPLDEQTWETFSAAWNADTQAAFNLVKAAVTMPLSSGSMVVLVSSGAAIDGSPLSGGYAGAKRMQWLLAEYGQQLSDKKELGIRFLAILPHQLIEGTEIGHAAASAYGAMRGISATDFLRRNWSVPLDVDKVAAAIVRSLRGDVGEGVRAIEVTGVGVASLG
jgi:NADP-dependent 3-hydroxy acid dehydrogenase YdfG